MMKCNSLEFKRLCLSDPNTAYKKYMECGDECPECSDYIRGILVLDENIRTSLNTAVPEDFKAKLKLRQVMETETQTRKNRFYYAVAASVMVAVIASVFMFQRINVQQDYDTLLAGIIEHMHESNEPLSLASYALQNRIKTQLASYDSDVSVGNIKGLRLSNICPMGQYRGIHAVVETDKGMVSFAYIKGEKLKASDLIDYGGYYSKVVPMGNGNLIIVSESKQALPEVEQNLVASLKWDI